MAQFRSAPVIDSQMLAAKMPPHSIEAEQSLLGGLLLDNSAWDRIGDKVSEGDFYRDDHRRIFSHISRLIGRGAPADVVRDQNHDPVKLASWWSYRAVDFRKTNRGLRLDLIESAKSSPICFT